MGIRLREITCVALVATSMAMQAWGQEDPHANCAMVGWVPRGNSRATLAAARGHR